MEKLYMFCTRVHTKERDNIWHDNPNDIYRAGETIEDALDQYIQAIYERDFIKVSKNACKHKEPIYYDTLDGETVQTGYTMKGSVEIFDDRRGERR